MSLELTVQATPKFFKRQMPKTEAMEFIVAPSVEHPGTVHLFLRHFEDSDYPSRIRIALTPAQAKDVAASLTRHAGGAK